jgi:hypothetical protein
VLAKLEALYPESLSNADLDDADLTWRLVTQLLVLPKITGAGRTQMSTIALIDTRLKIPGESIGTVVSTHDTIRAAFKANEVFQKRMRNSGVKDHVPTKIVTLKVRLGDGEHVNPGLHLFQERESQGRGGH